MVDADIRVTLHEGRWTIFIDETFSDPFPSCQQAIDCALALAEMLGDAGQDASVLVEGMDEMGDVLITFGEFAPDVVPERPTIH